MKLYYKWKSDRGYGYVILIYTHLSNRIELSPSVKCREKDFGDGRKDNPIKKSDLEFEGKNIILRSFKENVYLVIDKLKREGLEPTTELVKLGMKQFKRDLLIVKHIETTIDKFPLLYVLNEKYIKSLDKSTTYYRSICYRVRLIEDFIKGRGDENIDFREIDNNFYGDFEDFLVKKKYSNSTSAKIISQFRQFLLFSLRENFASKVNVDYRTKLSVGSKKVLSLNSKQVIELWRFREFDYSSGILDDYGKPIYLKHYEGWSDSSIIVKDELFRTIRDEETKLAKRNDKGELVGMETTNKYHYYTAFEVVKDMFLFSVATGLRWSDCVKIKVGDLDIENKEFSIIQQKTKEEVPIIENKLSKPIFEKYSSNKSSLQYLFPLNCLRSDFTRQNYLTKVNLHLKSIGKILKFNNSIGTIKRVGKIPTKNPQVPFYKLISFHMGRRTHATIGTHSGIDIKSIAEQMGHSSANMTTKYIGKDIKKLKTLFDFIDENNENRNLVDFNKGGQLEDVKGVKEVIQISNNEVLDSKLERLKTMRVSGLLPEEVYLKHVDDLLKEYGL